MLYIAVDFDGTITKDVKDLNNSDKPELRDGVVEFLNKLVEEGHFVYLYTARSDAGWEEAVQICKDAGLQINFEYGRKTIGKPFYDILFDDRAMHIGTCMTLSKLVNFTDKNTNTCPEEIRQKSIKVLSQEDYDRYKK